MPRTKSKKKDNGTPVEKLQQINSKIEKSIFFNYYDGYKTNGALGFDVNAGPAGSTKHQTGLFALALTTNQFRSKGKVLALLAKSFIDNEEEPPEELRPKFTKNDIEAYENANVVTKLLPERLVDALKAERECFVFFQYYDGYKTDGEIGFSPRAGPPGSINHRRSYSSYLSSWGESEFRLKGIELAALARECLEKNYALPENLCPPKPAPKISQNMMDEAIRGGYV